jgi:SAM-dependent methyltransferase
MSYEMQKSVIRRLNDSRFLREYFVGVGIDIGAGEDSLLKYKEFFPLIKMISSWDINDGDAQYLNELNDNIFDFAVSSHCLEHMVSPDIAIKNWLRILKPKGYLIITVPDEDLYEQGIWPSLYNLDHKFSFTINKDCSWNQKSINIFDLLSTIKKDIIVKKIELLDNLHFKSLRGIDQTRYTFSESAIEIVLQKI